MSRPLPPRVPQAPPGLAIALVVALATVVLVALHGHVLRYPFLEDDYIFITEAGRGLAGSLVHAFVSVGSYFRPIGRELHFWSLLGVAGPSPLVFHLANLGLLATILLAVALVGRRLGGLRAGLLAASFYALFYPHRVLLGYVSCVQDLLATALACAAVIAHLRGRSRWAGALYLLALLSKESVAPLPAALTAWAAWSVPSGTASRWRTALRATGPMWLAAGAWVVGVPLARAWFGDSGVRAFTVPGADQPVTLSSLIEGARATLLTLVGIEQPWALLRSGFSVLAPPSPGAAAGIVLATLTPVVIAMLTRPKGHDGANATASGAPAGLGRFGLLFLLVASVPPVLLGGRFNAYYVTLPALGFAWCAGRLLARFRPGLAAPVFLLAAVVNLAANGAPVFRMDLSDADPAPGVSVTTASRLEWESDYVRALHASLLEHRPPRGSIVYLVQPFGFRLMGTSADRAPRLWLGDPALEVRFPGSLGTVHPHRPALFLRFDPEPPRFTRLSDSLMFAVYGAAEAFAGGRYPEARATLERGLRSSGDGGHDWELGHLLGKLGGSCLQLGDTASARAAWLRAVSLPTGRPQAVLGLATLDLQMGRTEAARDWMVTGIRHDPDDVQLLRFLSHLERNLGRTAEADRLWQRVRTLHPQYADSVLRAGGVH